MTHLAFMFGGAIDTLGAMTFFVWMITGLIVAISVAVFLVWKLWYYMGRNIIRDIERLQGNKSWI